jgi:hypothetical protein
MDTFTPQYQYWLDKLGWATPEMLSLLTRGVPRADLPGGRDRVLERFLSKGVKAHTVTFQRFGQTRAYTALGRKEQRQRSPYHDVMAAQALVKLFLAFPTFERSVFAPRDFFGDQSPVVPDFGLTVALPNGSHAFAIEYQTYTEASRTTMSKLSDYYIHFESIKTLMKGEALWVVFVLERSREWVSELVGGVAYPFAYFIDAPTYFETPAIATELVFFQSGGGLVSLVVTV